WRSRGGKPPSIGLEGKMDSYVRGSTVVPLLDETIGAALDRTAARHASQDELVSRHQSLRYTYRELLAEVNRAARALALGVERSGVRMLIAARGFRKTDYIAMLTELM